MYHQQASNDAYGTPYQPTYAGQHTAWTQQMSQNVPLPNVFNDSFHSMQNPPFPPFTQPPQPQYPQSPQPEYPQPQYTQPQYKQPPPPLRRTSVQLRWEDYLQSDESSETLTGNDTYIKQVTSELEQRAISDQRLEQLQNQVDHAHAQAVEKERRLKWAQEMIISNPAVSAEIYCAMSRRAASPSSAATTPSADGRAGGFFSRQPSSHGSPT
ncbi:uncharacterized protein K452DRAFT_299870 [Aplosporella prunicola CBS 121167]|uniref:Uncharacterized protein n=1 Tax=Aplosporella prunicola CBS 121167 TaxID=1176127 RepID=A0A6A6B965_9PEZI|nr:uncharacterized protein K452DRAFT_299870 [Aplosporella prunicola CBS 121167]KAF2139893.1 hypothetical protein K452DRAFT_299870 [Aplosporella prunicola CBS 121167]